MCPLRYILLLLSLLVAMIGFSQAMHEQHEEMVSSLKKKEDEKDEKKKKSQTFSFRTLIDMLNGKYLYDVYKASRGMQIIHQAE
jgi:flagellar biosynthesis component FlhA